MLIIYFLLAFIFVLILVPICKMIAFKFDIVDKPSEKRKIHSIVKPYLGGVAVFLGSFLAYIVYLGGKFTVSDISFWLLGGALVFIGVVDDKFGMRAFTKLALQFAIAFATSLTIPGFSSLSFAGLTINFTIMQAAIIQSVWIVAMINAFNLIDGLDGLSSGLGAISLSFLWIVMQVSGILVGEVYVVIMIGSLLGFLFYNFYPATIFLGDAGSMFIGYYIGVISLNQFKAFTLTTTGILILVAFIPLLDILLAMLRRRANNQKIFSADALHFHHRLLRHGLSHCKAVLVMYGIMTVYAIASTIFALGSGKIIQITWIVIIIFTWLVIEYLYMLGDRFTIIKKTINRWKRNQNKDESI